MLSTARALHHVLKIGSLKDNIRFFRDKLKMTVLRHEVFGEGCKAACNGPYEGQWTKTMIGYGPESGTSANPQSYFVLELTYNYSVKQYALGNDLQYMKIALRKELFDQIVSNCGEQVKFENENLILSSPDGYKFIVSALDGSQRKQDIVEVCLSVKSLNESLKYWRDLLKMKKIIDDNLTTNSDTFARLSYDSTNQASISLKQIGETVEHKEAFGRTAFSIPAEELKPLEKILKDSGHKILVPYVSLDTPGKATVQVVICVDPDGHEICFVCDEGFRELSQPDEKIENLYF